MTNQIQEYCRQIIQEIENGGVKNRSELDRAKLQIGKKLGINQLPSNPDILMQATNHSSRVSELLSIKPLRTLSGVAPVAIMTKPSKCPHGKCIYCPGGVNSYFGDVPQSYTGHEPATMRGISNNYDAYLQTMNRISQYYAIAHKAEKLELIIMGGTFPAEEKEYQEEFISHSFQAANDFSEMFFRENEFLHKKFNSFFSKEKEQERKEKLLSLKNNIDVKREHARNESAKVRVVTLCIETKPDWSKQKHIDQMLHLGATRVEIGAQSLYEDVLKFTHRGHTLKDTVEATELLKDSGLKVTYHMMPGEPHSSKEKDIEMFRELFENPDYRPDALKIYPCMVMPGTALEHLYKTGKYKPLSTQESAEIIAEAKKYFPEYMRVHRIQRDIPTKFSLGGIDKNNLRQLVEEKCKQKGIKCRCIRCRESGINSQKGIETDYQRVKIVERNYTASNGDEIFISIEDAKNDLILGFCRLRMPHKPFRKEFTSNSACIRELHVFGTQLGIGQQNDKTQQHKGFGKMLVARAEQIAKEQFDAKKILVISGVGAREYYSKKLRYARDGAYMSKNL